MPIGWREAGSARLFAVSFESAWRSVDKAEPFARRDCAPLSLGKRENWQWTRQAWTGSLAERCASGFAVRTDPGKAPTAGSVGEFFWGGMMGTAFWVSPRDSLFAIVMVQTPEYRAYFRELFRNLVSAAIV